jgi:hypothetical protein
MDEIETLMRNKMIEYNKAGGRVTEDAWRRAHQL